MRLAPLVVVVVVAVVAALGPTAHADGMFFTESLGGAKIHDELGADMPGAMRIRLGVGIRHGAWAAEGFLAGLIGADGETDYRPSATYARPNGPDGMFAYGIDVKYLRPIADHVELYLRGSASKGALSGNHFDGYEGRGLGAGAGLQIKGKVPALGFLFAPLFFTDWGPKVTAALFVDTGYDFYRFHHEGRAAIDAQISTVMMGFAVGSDF